MFLCGVCGRSVKDYIVKNETGSEGSEKIGKFTWTILNDILPIFYQLPIFGQSRFFHQSIKLHPQYEIHNATPVI